MANFKLTHERLTDVLDFDPATGVFVWKVRLSNRMKVGARAGVVGTLGYRLIMVDGEKIQASRLAWFYVNKEWPKGDIKFKDDNADNCAIDNLKDMSRIESARLRSALSTNTSGLRGVSAAKGGWKAAVTANYKQVMLGVFKTKESASEAYEYAMAILSGASTPQECDAALDKIIQYRRKRVAWERLMRSGRKTEWSDFSTFESDIGLISDDEATIAALHESIPIGKNNYRWLAKVAGKFDRSTNAGRAAYAKAYRAANPDRGRHAHLKNNYDIDDIEFHRLHQVQGGRCLICETVPDERLAVDHDHNTGAVRGLICKSCNYALGQFGDNPTRLRRAVEYLERHLRASEASTFTPKNADRDWLLIATPGFGA